MLKDFLVNISGEEFECVDKGFSDNESVDVVIRPEDIKITSPDVAKIKGTVDTVTFKGVHYEMVVKSDNFNWLIHSTKAADAGAEIGMTFDPFDIHIMKKSV